MKQKLAIQSDSFWGDLANALALRPIYRKPLNQTQQGPPTPELDPVSRSQEQQEPAKQAQETPTASFQQEQEPAQASTASGTSQPATAGQGLDIPDITGAVQGMKAMQAVLSRLPAGSGEVSSEVHKDAVSAMNRNTASAIRKYLDYVDALTQAQPSATQQDIDHHIRDMLATTEMTEGIRAADGSTVGVPEAEARRTPGTPAHAKEQEPLTEKQLRNIGLTGTGLKIAAGLFQGKSFSQLTAELGKPRLEILREWNRLLDEHHVFSVAKLLTALRTKHDALPKKQKKRYALRSPLGKKTARRYGRPTGTDATITRSSGVLLIQVPATDAGKRVVIPKSEKWDYVVTSTDHHGSVVSELVHAGSVEETGESEPMVRHAAGERSEEE